MKRMLKEEFSQAFRGSLFWIALALGGLLALVHYGVEVFLPYHDPQQVGQAIAQGNFPSVFNLWMGTSFTTVESYLFFLILPLLAALPFAGSFCEELQTGFLRAKLLACRQKHGYYVTKALAVFVSGGVTVLAPLLLNLLCTAATVPALTPIASTGHFPIFPTGMWAGLYYTHPWRYTAAYLAVIFVYAGLFAQVALVASFYLQNRILVLLSPMLLYVFVYGFGSAISAEQFVPFCFLPLDQPVFGTSFGIVAAEAILLAATVWLGFVREGCRKDVF